MTTDRPAGPGAVRLERRLAVIVSVFGLLFTLQNTDALVGGWPSMRGPVGVAVVAVVAVSTLAGLSAAWSRVPTRPALTAAVAAYGVALALWPLALVGPVPLEPMAWLAALAAAPAAYCAVAARSVAVPVVAAVLAAGQVVLVLVLAGGTGLGDALVDGLFVVGVTAVLTVLVAALRRAVARADAAQRGALDGFARTRLDEATEAERVRTDALVHDCVLTTFLAASAAQTPETEDLAERMAANALRVLQHVNRGAGDRPVVPFARSVAEAADRLAPLQPHFAMRAEDTDAVVLPIEVADAMLEAMVQAMDNSVRHSGATDRTVRLSRLGPDGLRIVVADDGVGFDVTAAADRESGVRLVLQEGLRRVDGRADLDSAPGRGCTVVLSWGSVVIHGVVPAVAPQAVTA